MKHQINSISSMLIIILLVISSCSKNESDAGGGGYGGGEPVKQSELNISVTNWVITDNTAYYSYYPGLISSINPLNGKVSLFLEIAGDYRAISNHETISYEGGSLWVSIIGKDMNVYFRSFTSGPPPVEVRLRLVVYQY